MSNIQHGEIELFQGEQGGQALLVHRPVDIERLQQGEAVADSEAYLGTEVAQGALG